MTETAELPRTWLDVDKHVKFTLGMVLGVDDFDQEFAYLSARDRWLAGYLHGYGTTSGLAVTIEADQVRGPRINVAPGTAITPCGHRVCVTPAQCAYLNEWLSANRAVVDAALAARPQLSPPAGTMPLYVVLCYADCPTDELPIPGDPCRTEDSLTAPSRIKDDFRLELRTGRPVQREEDAVRDLVRWLRMIPVIPGPGSTLEQLEDALRDAVAAAVEAPDSPPGSPPGPAAGSPPGSPDAPYDLVLGLPAPGLAFSADDLVNQLRGLLGLWVTELRPVVRQAAPCGTDSCGCGCTPTATTSTSDCGCGPGFGASTPGGKGCAGCTDGVLLAQVDVSLVEDMDGALVVADDSWRVDETERPYLLHTRLLQELLLSASSMTVADSPPSGPSGPPISAVTATTVTGPPTAAWDPGTRILDLGIPEGAGVTSVVVSPLPAGTPPAVISFVGGVLTLGLAPARDGSPGPGIAAVTAVGLPAGTPPTATLAGQVLTLGLPAGADGPPGPGPSGPQVVAAGRFGPRGGAAWTFGKLTADPVPGFSIFYFATFPGFDPGHPYVLKGTAQTNGGDPVHTVEEVPLGDRDQLTLEVINALQANGIDPKGGIILRVCDANRKDVARGFSLEITDYVELTD